ncbi:hypothetical protein [Streptomyces sp. H39-S7]|uniref:hypothetical protein n=1 Tax=Streptomyces sp. H39-S7 TaxID=3004357 RepID=UPI0022AF0731|nr:hypothetical protein [Streptomyces sp. H39-S7]MCZ4124538.1 hypothetical protein [Streptomyces sp. H39-S7]
MTPPHDAVTAPSRHPHVGRLTGIRFFQTLGSALGAALLGTLLTRVFAAKLPGGKPTRLEVAMAA